MRMQRLIALVVAATPIATFAATHRFGVDVGEASTSGMRCPPAEAEFGRCKLDDDALRVYYEFAPTPTIGFRATHVILNDLRLTNDVDDVFTLPSISSLIHDLSVTVSYPLGEHSALRGRFGLAYWEESRGETLLTDDTSEGVAPVVGLGVDFGGRRVRAELFADLYPSVGDTDYVACYGIGVSFVFGGAREKTR